MTEELRGKVLAKADTLRQEIVEISRFVHNTPELGSEEYKCSGFLISKLKQHGFEVEEGILDMETAFKAIIRGCSEGPKVAFLAEYDALPELGHACGHNIIAAANVGSGIAMSGIISGLPGEIWVVGTPAEEGHGPSASSKVRMVEEGLLDDLDVVFTMHPIGDLKATARKQALAIQKLGFRFVGKASHAAAAPESGVNALNAAILTFRAIDALRQHIRSDARVHGIITRGGEAFNIVPEKCEALMGVRAADLEYLEELVEKVKDCARGAALATGTRVEIRDFLRRALDILVVDALARRLEENLSLQGIEVASPLEARLGGLLGSTDFGNVSHHVPSVCAFVPISCERLALHSRDFSEAATSSYTEEVLVKTVKALTLTALEVMTKPELLKSIRDEFRAR